MCVCVCVKGEGSKLVALGTLDTTTAPLTLSSNNTPPNNNNTDPHKNITQQHINGTKCGACWAFSAVAVMEITQAMADGPKALVSASEQMLIDCDVKKDHGCDGGGYLNAIRW